MINFYKIAYLGRQGWLGSSSKAAHAKQRVVGARARQYAGFLAVAAATYPVVFAKTASELRFCMVVECYTACGSETRLYDDWGRANN
jgi:hypothetical protein